MTKRFAVILGSLAVLLVSLFLVYGAQAAFPGEGLTISPPINEPKVKPGQTVENVIRITNPTANMIEIYPQAMDFKAAGEGGEPTFYVADSDSDKFSLAKWISFETTKIALTPEQIVEFRYTLTVPEDAEPGGHYGAVFFVSEPPTDDAPGSKVTIGSMVGSLVLLTVPGETIEKGVVDEFTAGKSFFIRDNKTVFTTKISNIGNIHFKPKGNIVIKSVFGGGAKGTLSFNEQGGNVLPDSTRKFTNEWKYPWYQVGIYRAELATIYGISEKPLTSTFIFWIIPLWLIITLLVLVVVMIVTIWLVRRNSTPRGPKPPKANRWGRKNKRNQPVILR
jgi:hypothetical protein